MGTLSFPSLRGLGYSLIRRSLWKTRTQTSMSGKETRLADWSYPRYQWELTFNFLQQGSFAGATAQEMATLMGFYNTMSGGFDTFLYQDQDDHTVTGQQIAVGDGSTAIFQLCRTFGGATEPLLAVTSGPGGVGWPNVYLNGGLLGSGWNFARWGGVDVNGSATPNAPGSIWFATPPAAGTVITVDMTYSFPCRFDEDKCEFEKFSSQFHSVKTLAFTSIK